MDEPDRIRNRIIDSRQIAAFAALVRHRSFTTAAEELFLTQSAVSHAIKSLEADIGCRLFERRGRAISLTRAGEQLHLRTEKILSEMRAARLEIEHLSPKGESQLCVGAGTLACQYILPSVLKEFRQTHPKCRVRLEPGNLPNLLELLYTHQIDFALGVDSAPSEDFSFEKIFEDELLFFISPQHAWGKIKRVPHAAIVTETFVVPMKQGQTSAILDKYFRTEKISPKNLIAAGSLDAAKQLVGSGFGVGFFAHWQVAAEAAAGSLVAVPLTTRRLIRSWVVARLKGREPQRIEQEFIQRCKSVLTTLAAVGTVVLTVAA
ncbi:MAG: LysR family transcriptional regulator [Verrucomicrobia bacterium]|nr:LysR family transcriptional regulator [Verrucomicrobiota bacterium]